MTICDRANQMKFVASVSRLLKFSCGISSACSWSMYAELASWWVHARSLVSLKLVILAFHSSMLTPWLVVQVPPPSRAGVPAQPGAAPIGPSNSAPLQEEPPLRRRGRLVKVSDGLSGASAELATLQVPESIPLRRYVHSTILRRQALQFSGRCVIGK